MVFNENDFWVNKTETETIIPTVYVDDLIIVTKTNEKMNKINILRRRLGG